MGKYILSILETELETPKPYGMYHLIWLICTLFLIILLFFRRNKNNEKQLKIVIGTYSIIAFILEALKNNDKFINNWFLQSEESIRSNDTFEDHNILDIDKNVEIKKEEREKESRAKEEQVRLLERRKFERISLIILMGLEIACRIKLSKDLIRYYKRQKECDAISNSDDMIKTR